MAFVCLNRHAAFIGANNKINTQQKKQKKKHSVAVSILSKIQLSKTYLKFCDIILWICHTLLIIKTISN